jgi:DNA repair exonuclease SbcCD ATPase subunit
MDIFGIGETGSMVALALAGSLLVVMGTALSSWSRRRAARRAGAVPQGRRARRSAVRYARTGPELSVDEVPRIAALERSQAEIVARLSEMAAAQSAPEERLKAMASQMLGLIRDKNATLETALAGLDQLRARMSTLEKIGDAAEARGLLETLEAQIAASRDAEAEARAGMEARLRALETPDANPFGEISDQLTRLYAQKDAAVEVVLGKLGPLEARIAGIEATVPAGASALARLEEELATLRAGAAETARMLDDMRSSADASGALDTRIAAVEADGAALARALTERLDGLAREMQGRDPAAALAGLEGRLDGLRAAAEAGTAALAGRIAALEAPGENPFAEISDQLARLYGQKDAAVETVLAKLGPLEAKIDAVEGRLDGLDPAALLDRFAARFEGVQARLDALEAPGESPFGEIADQLTRLYAQKDATVESVFTRLAPLEARLAEVETALAGADPAAEIAALRSALEVSGNRMAALEAGQGDVTRDLGALRAEAVAVSDIAGRLETLQAGREALSETLMARLGSLETEIAARDPQEALDRFAARLEALTGRVETLETPGESPFAEISDQLTRLYAQKDATVETVFARLAPLEARLAEMEDALDGADRGAEIAGLRAAQETLRDGLEALGRDVADRDPAVELARFAERMERVQVRLDVLEAPGESPFAEISEQLTRLYAQKDATVETVFARLAPMEARLGEVEEALTSADPTAALAALEARMDGLKEAQVAQGGSVADLAGRLERLSEITTGAAEALRGRLEALERDRASSDPAAMLAGFGERMAAMQKRLEVLELPGESPFAEIADQLTRLYAQKDATVETVFARLAPLEARLAEVESELVTRDPAPALAGLTERLAGMEALPPRLAALEDTALRQDALAAVSDRLGALDREAARTEALDAVSQRLDALDRDAARVPALDRVAARLDALDWAQDEAADRLEAVSAAGRQMAERARETARDVARDAVQGAVAPVAGIAEQLGALFSRREAAVEAVLDRLAPVEARLADLEARPWDPEADETRAGIQAIAAQIIAARAAAEHTELFAERLAVLEASLPRLSAEQSLMMRDRAGQGTRPSGPRPRAAFGEPDPGRVLPAVMDGAAPGGMEEVWALPRLVSLHHKQ